MPEPSRLSERGGALLEEAAERSRTSMRDAARAGPARVAHARADVGGRDRRLSDRHRGRRSQPAVLRADRGLHHARHHDRPARAPRGRAGARRRGRHRGRRRARVAARQRASGAIAVVVPLAMGAAVFLGTGQIFATQAAVSAVLVAVLQQPGAEFSGARFVDALIGGGLRAARELAAAARRPAQDGAPRRRAGARRAGRDAPRASRSRSRRAARSGPSRRCCARAASTSSSPTSRRR